MSNLMIKAFVIGFYLFAMSSCKKTNVARNYFGQTEPGSIPEVFAPDIISQEGRMEHGISFSPDMQEMAFGIINSDDSGTIWYATKSKENWHDPKVFEPLKEQSCFLPYLTPDGRSMVYAISTSDTARYITNIGIVNKKLNAWGQHSQIQGPINTMSREASACMTIDRTIYLSSNRNCEGKENCFTADLFSSKYHDNGYATVTAVQELLSDNDEESIFISPNEDYMIFCRYTDNKTFFDLYISYRNIENNWTAPALLDSSINSDLWDRRPFVTLDNNLLFYTRLDIGAQGLTESDIYWVNTSQLFKPFVYHSISDVILESNQKFQIDLPSDYFKDIDGKQLTLSLNPNHFNWITFDPQEMKLHGQAPEAGVYDLTFTAVDEYSNKTEELVNIIVKK